MKIKLPVDTRLLDLLKDRSYYLGCKSRSLSESIAELGQRADHRRVYERQRAEATDEQMMIDKFVDDLMSEQG